MTLSDLFLGLGKKKQPTPVDECVADYETLIPAMSSNQDTGCACKTGVRDAGESPAVAATRKDLAELKRNIEIFVPMVLRDMTPEEQAKYNPQGFDFVIGHFGIKRLS